MPISLSSSRHLGGHLKTLTASFSAWPQKPKRLSVQNGVNGLGRYVRYLRER
jgi:hypothetical protein